MLCIYWKLNRHVGLDSLIKRFRRAQSLVQSMVALTYSSPLDPLKDTEIALSRRSERCRRAHNGMIQRVDEGLGLLGVVRVVTATKGDARTTSRV